MGHVFVIDRRVEAELMTSAMLERAGQDVGPRAIGGTIVVDVQVIDGDLLLFSMVMPKFDGCEVFRAVRHLKPDAAIIAISFGDTARVTEAVHRLGGPAGVGDPTDERQIWEELIRLSTDVVRAGTDAGAWHAEGDAADPDAVDPIPS